MIRRCLDAIANLECDYINPYVADLANLVDMELLAASGLKLGVEPLGRAAFK